jgi:class 3 adenylate cyclase
MKQPVERRLAAILAADVAGYSRLMGADEEGTHERLKAHLSGLVDPKIKEHRGRIVKNTGDGLLAEFPSLWTPGAAPLRFNAECSIASRRCPTSSAGSGFALASTSAM